MSDRLTLCMLLAGVGLLSALPSPPAIKLPSLGEPASSHCVFVLLDCSCSPAPHPTRSSAMLQAPKKRVAAVPAGVKKVCSMPSLPPPPPPLAAGLLPAGSSGAPCLRDARERWRAHWHLLLIWQRNCRAQAPAATKTVNPLFEKRPKTFGARLASPDKSVL